MRTWAARLHTATFGAALLGLMALWLLTAALGHQWLHRADLPSWYTWPATIIPDGLERDAAMGLCRIGFSQQCAPVAAPTEASGLSCWAAQGETWCVDPPFATATLVWTLLGLAVYGISRLTAPHDPDAASDDPESRVRRNDHWVVRLLNFVFVPWLLWEAYDGIRGPTGPDVVAKCTVDRALCVFDRSDTLPGALVYAVTAVWFLFVLVQQSYQYRHDFFLRTAAASESRKKERL